MSPKFAIASFALTTTVLLSSCGGGSEPAETAVFSQALRQAPAELAASARPSWAKGAMPQLAAHARFTWPTFLAWAVASYPHLFSGAYQDGTYGEYTYRYWPATDHYLAIKGADGLYALGPATDRQILSIGTLGELVCAVYPANCVVAASDVPGSASSTVALSFGALNASTIDSAGDQDWWVVNLVAGTAYTFTMAGQDTGQGTLSDPVLKIVDASGREVAAHDDINYPSNRNAAIAYTPSTTGRYFVAAHAYTTASGTYQLAATQSGGGSATNPAPVGPSAVSRIPRASAGSDGSAVIKPDGSLWVWGYQTGELGAGPTDINQPWVDRPTMIMNDVKSVDLANGCGVAVKTDGSLWVWGAYGGGRCLTNATIPEQRADRPVKLADGFSMVSISAPYSGAAITTDGALLVWRDWDVPPYGNLRGVAMGTGFMSVSSGGSHLVALKADGSLWGLGDNHTGALGPELTGTGVNGRVTRTLTQFGSGFVDAVARYHVTYALKADGTIVAYGTGRDAYGAAQPEGSFQPRVVGQGFVSLSGGNKNGDNLYAIKPDGSVWGLGSNEYGQFGTGAVSSTAVATMQPTGLRMAVVANGYKHTAGLGTDGNFYQSGAVWHFNFQSWSAQTPAMLTVASNGIPYTSTPRAPEDLLRPRLPTSTGGTGGTGSTGSTAACAALTPRSYPGDRSDPQVYSFDAIAMLDQCLYRATGDARYLTDGNYQCRVLNGLLRETNSRFRPLYCNGSSMKL